MTAWSPGLGLGRSLEGSCPGSSGVLVARGSTSPAFLRPCPGWWRASPGPASSVGSQCLPFPRGAQMPSKKGQVSGERWPRVLWASPVRPRLGTRGVPSFPRGEAGPQAALTLPGSEGGAQPGLLGAWVGGWVGFSLPYDPTWWARGWEWALPAQKERARPNGLSPLGAWRRKYGRNVWGTMVKHEAAGRGRGQLSGRQSRGDWVARP